MPRSKNISQDAIEHLREVIGDTSLAEFVRSLNREGWSTNYQNVQRYLKGENEIQPAFAREVARVYGVTASWVLGLSPYKTPVEESIARVGEFDTRNKKKRLLIDLMADMSGWIVEDMHMAASFGESEAKGIPPHVAISKDGTRRELDILEYDRFIGKMLDYFDFELSHM